MTFLPLIGFVLYVLFGGGLSVRTRLLIKRKKLYTTDYYKYINWQADSLKNLKVNQTEFDYAKDIINFVNKVDSSTFSSNNSVKVFCNGQEKIQALKKDLMEAKQTINIEYYIFANDKVGKEIMSILCEKAKQGVKVRLIYDSIGCLGTPRRFFRKLKKAGGEVAEFFPPFMGIRLINLKINYRNHRKIVVIDGKIAYTGGINIRDDHMGKVNRLSPWRDKSIRLEGKVVWDLQNVFFNDFRCCKKQKIKNIIEQDCFNQQAILNDGNIGAQVVTSGPETTKRDIEDAYIKLINGAKKTLYIQTPYFIPDDIFLKSLIFAKRSGVDVKVMIPGKPDKKTVYFATLSFIKELLDEKIEVYAYNGFLHSKTLLVDDLAVSIGTCNTDNRSFALNFELTTILYNKQFVEENKKIFENDIKNSKLVTIKKFNQRAITSKLAQAIFRLFSPIL